MVTAAKVGDLVTIQNDHSCRTPTVVEISSAYQQEDHVLYFSTVGHCFRSTDIIDPEPVRPDFDFRCECGYYSCADCHYPLYPMEVDNDDLTCPICGGPVSSAS